MPVEVPQVGTLMRAKTHRLLYEDDSFHRLLHIPEGTSAVVVDYLRNERIAAIGVIRMIKMLLDDGRVGYVPIHDLRHFDKISGPP